MIKLTKVQGELVKSDEGEFFMRRLKKFNLDLDNLAPGVYKVNIEVSSDRLKHLKKYYFVMETNLAMHLGMKKTELHEATKKVEDFMKIDSTTSELKYDSVADIKDEEEMMARIYTFQIWSATEFRYKHEPFTEEK